MLCQWTKAFARRQKTLSEIWHKSDLFKPSWNICKNQIHDIWFGLIPQILNHTFQTVHCFASLNLAEDNVHPLFILWHIMVLLFWHEFPVISSSAYFRAATSSERKIWTCICFWKNTNILDDIAKKVILYSVRNSQNEMQFRPWCCHVYRQDILLEKKR